MLTHYIGLFEALDLAIRQQRVGQRHTPGREIHRLRQKGQNSLESRYPQHGTPSLLGSFCITLQTAMGALLDRRQQRRTDLVISQLAIACGIT
ncbi:hypothetical protein D3C80_1484570 [compost metagenome]